MPTYIMLISWTDQGVRAIGDSPQRLDAARAALAGMGGRFASFYMTMGAHDMVAIVEAPDDAVIARFALMLGKGGNVRTQTMKAFSEAEYREIIGTVG